MINSAIIKDGDVLRDVSESTHLMIAVPLDEDGPHGMVEAEGDGTTDSIVVPQVGLKLNTMVGNDLGVDDGNAVSLLDGSGVLQSQESRCGFQRCVGQKGDKSSSACMDMIKTCTCSFCRKAACLWSDIYSQDIKGRINAIKKSQKQASILVDRNSMNGSRNFGKVPNSESDLTGRWKSLFLHMENVFVHEGTQLETSLSTLKNLVDDCKTNSEKN
ncbi:hypothetical protein M8C21_032848 [Ambrosia artemisiifolia]|uniref:Uncharacterized protein n=1 Tax=Ambrosia artemisiifolia TaxID=4212 RepID=A0AAD5G8Q2_AMBAR|nr:hypothetical protein M8C21_032848 [Ambrosia artemisiifolia]